MGISDALLGKKNVDGTPWIDSIELNLGGNGANTSYALSRLGVPVRLLGMVGRDAGTGDPPGLLPEPADHHNLSGVPVLGRSARNPGFHQAATHRTMIIPRICRLVGQARCVRSK